MRGEIIAVGDELLCGKSLDTNSRWLAERLGECGVSVRWHTTIGDQLDDYVTAFELARRRSDLVVCTGGLGPTEDDLTRVGLARVAGVDLQFDESSWEQIRAIFGRRQRPVPEKNRVQAMFPQGSRVIPNPHGTAPGIDLAVRSDPGASCRFFALPGVPAEMHEMWRGYVEPELQRLAGGRRMVQRTLRCFGAGESDIEQMIPAEIMARGRDPLVGITASDATISLRVATFDQSAAGGLVRIEPIVRQLRDVLGNLVYGEEDQTLADVVVGGLAATGGTIAVLDLGLRGLLGQWLSEADSEGAVFLGSIQAASLPGAEPFFSPGVPTGAGGDLVAYAQAIRDRWGATLGVAVGAPRPAAKESLPPEFHLAVASPERAAATRFAFAGHPALRRPRAAKQVLNHLRLDWLCK